MESVLLRGEGGGTEGGTLDVHFLTSSNVLRAVGVTNTGGASTAATGTGVLLKVLPSKAQPSIF